MVKTKGCITKERDKIIRERLNRIKGQLNGLERMLEEKRYCLEILQQISSIHEALRGVGKIIMINYLEICVTDALRSRRKDKQKRVYAELMDIIYKFAK